MSAHLFTHIHNGFVSRQLVANYLGVASEDLTGAKHLAIADALRDASWGLRAAPVNACAVHIDVVFFLARKSSAPGAAEFLCEYKRYGKQATRSTASIKLKH